MATYRFFANMQYSHEIEVEADSYDEAYDLASTEAWDFDVSLSSGYTMPFDHIELEDSYIPDYMED